MSESVELRATPRAELGEGAIWDETEQVLYWVDINGGKLFRFDPATDENRAYQVSTLVSTVVPRRQGGVLVAVDEGVATFDLASETLSVIANPEPHRPEQRFNDGKCDPAGRFWVGTMARSQEAGAGSLYRIDPDGSSRAVRRGLTLPNGIAWSPDQRTMYHIDTVPRTVTAYPYDGVTGEIGEGRVAIQIPDGMGYPDGMSIDGDGMLWIAHYGDSRVRRWHPERGEVLQTIELPASKVTSCAFGGTTFETLYITTATENMSDEEKAQEPLAGSLFSVEPGVRGLPFAPFAG